MAENIFLCINYSSSVALLPRRSFYGTVLEATADHLFPPSCSFHVTAWDFFSPRVILVSIEHAVILSSNSNTWYNSTQLVKKISAATQQVLFNQTDSYASINVPSTKRKKNFFFIPSTRSLQQPGHPAEWAGINAQRNRCWILTSLMESGNGCWQHSLRCIKPSLKESKTKRCLIPL